MIYTYLGVNNKPVLAKWDVNELVGGILYEIKNSSMVDTNVDYLTWFEGEGRLDVVMVNALSSEDKQILDSIISNYQEGV